MRIQISTETAVLDATLNDSVAASELADLLPLTLTLSDFHQTEKIADLPNRLSTTGSPAGTSARAGDIAYYAPWGNLAIFYRDFAHSAGLITLGRIHGPLDVLTETHNGQTITITSVR